MKTLMGSRSPTPSAANWRWDDVRVLLVLARERKITSAARTLGVDAATITRRLQSLESALGITLFQRTGRGLRATEQLEALLPLFANVENSMRFAFAEAERFHSSEEGLVRLSAGPTLVEHWLIPSLPELHRRAPTILLELDCSAHLVDPQQREADIAVRLSKPRGSGLIARRIASLAMMLAVTPELARGAVDRRHRPRPTRPRRSLRARTCPSLRATRQLAIGADRRSPRRPGRGDHAFGAGGASCAGAAAAGGPAASRGRRHRGPARVAGHSPDHPTRRPHPIGVGLAHRQRPRADRGRRGIELGERHAQVTLIIRICFLDSVPRYVVVTSLPMI
jgi:DNA-binding transcriptional LysR family regulator